MAYLPAIESTTKQYTPRVLEFKGYNDSSIIADGEMRDMFNLTSDKYPKLWQRNLRNTYMDGFISPSMIFSRREKLAVVDSGKFYYGTETIDGQVIPKLVEGLTLADNEKTMAAINTRVVIFPDKKWYNTDTGAFGDLDNTVERPESITVTFGTNTITFSGTGTPFTGFNADDAVTITGCTTYTANNISAVISSVADRVLTFPDNSFTAGVEAGDITIKRVSPDMDFIMESNNRLWGCKGSTIYASKLGDPLNWNYFQGLLKDSYAVEVGSDGDFTGCAKYPSHLLFFKENYIHKLYGNKPSLYSIVDAECYALEKGSHRSIQIVNEVVFYKSRLGIMAYTGGSPELISSNFGTKRYEITVAGTDRIKYYASMKYGDTYDMMVYDLNKSLWHKEDNVHAKCFAYINGELIYIDDATEKLVSINPSTADESDQITWRAVFGFDEYLEDKKIYSKIKMRLKLEDGSDLTISINTDEKGWVPISHIYAEAARAVYIPIIPQRCNKFQIRLEGIGFCLIESMVREYTVGSER